MKTAIEELIEWCNQYEGQMISADQVVLHAHKLLEKEKEQIINAHTEGYSNYDSEMTSIEYYNQTYNN